MAPLIFFCYHVCLLQYAGCEASSVVAFANVYGIQIY